MSLPPEGTLLTTLVITDLVASTRMTEDLGDAKASEIFGKQDRLARDLLAQHKGTEIDKTDGFLLFFVRPIEAVNFSLAYHRALDDLSQEVGGEVATRVGIHLGEVVVRKDSDEDVARGANAVEVEGLAKPFTARLIALAVGRQTLLSHSVFDVARRAAVGLEHERGELQWVAHGGYLLKGVEDPVEVFEVGVDGFAPLTPPPDSEKAKRADDDGTVLGWRPAPDQEIPRRPRWIVQEKLGEGGFGEVWLAKHQTTGDRRVFKFCYETERLKALQREVTLFRLLKEDLGDRPDINRILDWNFEDAPYFIETEYCRGGSLIDWVKSQGGLESVPLDTRLEILARVAEALAAAHSVGVLHKDVKPANVLLRSTREDTPQICLTDFGIGLLTDKSRLEGVDMTMLGLTDVMSDEDTATATGTFRYLAPELIEERPATVQADIYALGVMLYQIVVGDFKKSLAPGWERGVDDELLREDIAAAVDGNPQRRLGNALRIAERLRSLDKRRAEREAERKAAEQEVRARKRRKVAYFAAATSSALLVIMAIFSVMIYRAQQVAEENLRLAQDAVDQTLTELGSEELANVPQMEAVRRRILETARTFYLEFQKREPSDPDLRMEPALAHRRLGDIYRLESDIEAANAEYQTSIEMLTTLVAEYADRPDYRDALAHTHNMRGELLRDHEEHRATAAAAYEEALEVQSTLVEQLAGGRLPDGRDPRVALARTYNNRGILLHDTRDNAAAEMSYREAIGILEEIATAHDDADDGSGDDHRLELSRVYNNVGALYDQTGRPEEARTAFELAVTHLETLAVGDPDKRLYQLELSKSSNNLAYLLFSNGADLGEALDVNDKALDSFTELARPIPEISGEHGHSHWVRGVILRDQGAEREAQLAFERSIEIYRDLTAAPSDYAQGTTFHLRFAWVRWVESPARAASLGGMSSRDRAGVCGDYAWLATELSGEEIAVVMAQENYSAAVGVLSECSRLFVGAGNGGGAASGGASRYEPARQALASKFNGQGATGSW